MPTKPAASRMGCGLLVRSFASIALAMSSAACATPFVPATGTADELYVQCEEIADGKHRRSWGSFKMIRPPQFHVDAKIAACDAWRAELTGVAPAQASRESQELAARLSGLSKAERRAQLDRACMKAMTADARGLSTPNWRASTHKRTGAEICAGFVMLAPQ